MQKGTDLGFDDPFFATSEAVKVQASKSLRKEERQKRREAKALEAAQKATERAGLELLMQDDNAEAADHLDHFDINEIARAEKAKKKRQRMRKGKDKDKEVEEGKRGGLQEGFEIDVKDPRFAAVHDRHEFAIDRSHPRFKGTEGMRKLLEEGRKRKGIEGDAEVEVREKKRKMGGEGDEGDEGLGGLVEKVKKKSRR